MPNWDEDSPHLRKNLAQIFQEIAHSALRRQTPTIETARHWHAVAMQGLDVPDSRYVGAFRGEPGLEKVQVRVGSSFGTDSAKVAGELARFQAKLQAMATELDALVAFAQEPDADQLAAIIDTCAWVHTEWLQIHPFANGNGRTARLWANSIAMRYGLPPFIRLRPRPDAGYQQAGVAAMKGDWKPTAAVFRRLLDDFLNEI